VAPAPVDPCADVKQQVANLSSALNLANCIKYEFEKYLRDGAHQASVNEAAAQEGNAPVELMIRWGNDNHNAGKVPPY
jgi:hypothetical protein